MRAPECIQAARVFSSTIVTARKRLYVRRHAVPPAGWLCKQLAVALRAVAHEGGGATTSSGDYAALPLFEQYGHALMVWAAGGAGAV
jgi:hypothetical protein